MIRILLATLASLVLSAPALSETILFVGNSFTFGANSAVRRYRADTVTDLNREGIGGVPALFKAFTQQAGLDYEVSLETSPGKTIGWHLANRREAIDRAWDHVVLQGHSLIDPDRPGDARRLIDDAARAATMIEARNPAADIRLFATWPRADQTYRPGGHWLGRPIAAMAQDVARAHAAADLRSAAIDGVIPVGLAWNRAFAIGIADPNPYDGVDFGRIDLWSWDQYHASTHGYYLTALVVFGSITGRDPRALGRDETAAADLGLSPDQAAALQQVAHDTLAADDRRSR